MYRVGSILTWGGGGGKKGGQFNSYTYEVNVQGGGKTGHAVFKLIRRYLIYRRRTRYSPPRGFFYSDFLIPYLK
jgi:hypothetical protein